MAAANAATTPLPKWKIFAVMVVQAGEALGVGVLFPFVIFMLRDFGVPEAHLGTWSGILGEPGQRFISWGRLLREWRRRRWGKYGRAARPASHPRLTRGPLPPPPPPSP